MNILAINIHIPGGGKLTKQDCTESFLKAAEYYAPLFEDKTVIFHCNNKIQTSILPTYLNAGGMRKSEIISILK